jgi:peptidoglycan/LPS O-acetylase OafA/YrhL
MQDDESAVSHTRLAYLPALDGMRACAVLAVMMFHGGIPHMDGGFMGVDAFFVLSGFLITSLLLGEWRQALTIKLGAFWARRARRLLPALLLMLLFVAFFASVIVPKGTYGALRLDALATLLYVSNWHFILVNSNYFNETSASSPLLHTWSLAVEEQFYVIWPLVVLAVMRFTRSLRALFALCCAAAIASALWMHHVYGGGVDTNRAYLGTDTRAQCLFIGCALAVGLVIVTERRHEVGRLARGELWRPESSTGKMLCGVLGALGAAGAVTLWVLTTSTSTFPYSGGFFLIGLSVASVILAAIGAPRSIVPRMLSWSPVRYVGRISYGLYIWHWPIFIWLDHARTGLYGYELFAVRVAVTFAVSVVSFHLVERPIRMGTFVTQWRAWLVVPAGVGAVLVAVIAATTGTTAVASTALPGGAGNTGSSSTTTSTTGTTGTSVPAVTTNGPPVKVLLVGDSIAETLGEGLGEIPVQDKYDYVLYDRAILGCGVADGTEVEDMGAVDSVVPACGGPPAPNDAPSLIIPWATQWTEEIAQLHPNVVVEGAGRWELVDRLYQGKWENILQPQLAAYIKSQLEKAADLVNAAGLPMVFLTAPCTDEPEQPDGAAWPEDNPARRNAYNRMIREIAAAHPRTVSVDDLDKAACPMGRYASTVQGVVIRTVNDGVHFTPQGGVFLAPAIVPPMVAAGRAQMAGGTTSSTAVSAGG